jgi:hypothetical protein
MRRTLLVRNHDRAAEACRWWLCHRAWRRTAAFLIQRCVVARGPVGNQSSVPCPFRAWRSSPAGLPRPVAPLLERARPLRFSRERPGFGEKRTLALSGSMVARCGRADASCARVLGDFSLTFTSRRATRPATQGGAVGTVNAASAATGDGCRDEGGVLAGVGMGHRQLGVRLSLRPHSVLNSPLGCAEDGQGAQSDTGENEARPEVPPTVGFTVF